MGGAPPIMKTKGTEAVDIIARTRICEINHPFNEWNYAISKDGDAHRMSGVSWNGR